MGMSYAYGPADESESLRVLARYLELGGNFLDTAETYGPYENEKLLGKFLVGVPREKVVIATKFGFKLTDGKIAGVNSTPANIRKVCDESLQRLGLEYIDLFYQHRVDPDVPIEDVVSTVAELIKAGKVRAIGLSEAGPETLRKAHAVHPIAALQTEYDWRRTNPRFLAEAMERNLELANHVISLASKKGCTLAQLALAWVLGQGDDIVPIPGTKRVKYLEDNMGAVDVSLTPQELTEIDKLFPIGAAAGTRYPEAMMGMLE
jgi:aryl-alcohol dehydrogenase-like predicted oxidoreductase